MSKCHIIGDHMSQLNYVRYPPISQFCLIQWNERSKFWTESLSTAVFCACELQRLWQVCAFASPFH